MKNYLFIIIVFLLHQTLVVAQRNPDAEIEKMANSLAMQLKNKGVKMAAVADFTYQGQTNTRIGKYLADELSSKLTMQGHSMMNRDKVREGIAEQEAKKQAQSNKTASRPANDSLALWNAIENGIGLIGSGKALKGADAIIYGDIEDWEDDLRVVIQVTKNNAKRENIGAATGNFTKTPQIRRMVEGAVAMAQPPVNSLQPSPSNTSYTPTIPAGSNSISAKHENLTFELTGCRQMGREIECKLNIIASDKDEKLQADVNDCRIFDANGGHEFVASEIKLADKGGTSGWIQKALVADNPIESSFRFTNVNRQVSSIARMELRFYSDNNSYFMVKLYSVPVR